MANAKVGGRDYEALVRTLEHVTATQARLVTAVDGLNQLDSRRGVQIATLERKNAELWRALEHAAEHRATLAREYEQALADIRQLQAVARELDGDNRELERTVRELEARVREGGL